MNPRTVRRLSAKGYHEIDDAADRLDMAAGLLDLAEEIQGVAAAVAETPSW